MPEPRCHSASVMVGRSTRAVMTMMGGIINSQIARMAITTTTPIRARPTDTMVRNGSITASFSASAHGMAGDGAVDGIAVATVAVDTDVVATVAVDTDVVATVAVA